MPRTPEPEPDPAEAIDSELGGVVVHWRDEEGLARLAEAWPPAFPLVVIDNSQSLETSPSCSLFVERPNLFIERPKQNLGFGGGVNRGVQRLKHIAPSCRFLLILNPDAAPESGAVERLLEFSQRWCADPRCAGVAPALLDDDLSTQHQWQLQPLPSASTLLAQIFFLGGERGPQTEPEEGATVEQPAAAVLALDLERIRPLGDVPFDPGFYPAWFDDVDLARRLAKHRLSFRYAPAARFFHARGSSVPALGYGRFLWIYYRNLLRYLGKHHGRLWAFIARGLLPLSMILRLGLLPLRSPTRATGRLDAARGLVGVAAGALSGWRSPRSWAAAFEQPSHAQPSHEQPSREPPGREPPDGKDGHA